MTVWYQKCSTSITQIKWCLLYFDDETEEVPGSPSKKPAEPED
jgi:hypothetical protein